MKEIDVREYPPCEPMRMALEAANELEDNESVKIIHRQMPNPLFEILTKRGFSYKAVEIEEDLVHIIITKDNKGV